MTTGQSEEIVDLLGRPDPPATARDILKDYGPEATGKGR